MFRSICAIECTDHMFYVVLIVCIICIYMITLGSPCKRHEVLTRKKCPDSQARKSWLGQEVRIVMHGRLSRGMSALDKELATVLVGSGVWYDIDSNRVWYMECVCMLEEFLIIQ